MRFVLLEFSNVHIRDEVLELGVVSVITGFDSH